MGVLSVTGLKDSIAGHGDPSEMSAEQIGATINQLKSNWHLLMVEKGEEEFERVSVQFGGHCRPDGPVFARRVAAGGPDTGRRGSGWASRPIGHERDRRVTTCGTT